MQRTVGDTAIKIKDIKRRNNCQQSNEGIFVYTLRMMLYLSAQFYISHVNGVYFITCNFSSVVTV